MRELVRCSDLKSIIIACRFTRQLKFRVLPAVRDAPTGSCNLPQHTRAEEVRANESPERGLVTITAEWRSWIGGHEAQSGATTTHRFMGLRVN